MASPWQSKTCVECGREWETRSLKARTCSPKCRAVLREREHGPTRGAAPREYPEEMVLKVREMYAAGHTIAEIQSQVSGAKVQNLMVRYGIERRSSAKRNQRGERNHMWRGSNAGYQALHLRVEAERGKPSCCVTCGTDDPDIRYEWANLTGNYADTSDFERMCVACHRVFDAARRAETGERTSPVRR